MLSFETGQLAKQSPPKVFAQYGDTVVINAVTSGPPRPGIDFFPLTCDYRERTAAAGKFPGGFIKREGRPTNKETLTSRLIDRPIRPLFPRGSRTKSSARPLCLASDRQNDSDVLAMNGMAAAALFISPLPFHGPVASARVGHVDGQLVAFPTHDQLEVSDLDLIVSGTGAVGAMIEGFAREMPEDLMVEAIVFCPQRYSRSLCPAAGTCREGRRRRRPFRHRLPATLYDRLKDKLLRRIQGRQADEGKQARAEAVAA